MRSQRVSKPHKGSRRHAGGCRINAPPTPTSVFSALVRAPCRVPAFFRLRVPTCAGAPSPARVRFAGAHRPRLRRPGPAHCALPSVAGAGPPLLPPHSAVRAVCAAARLRGLSLPPTAPASASAALRASFASLSVALASLVRVRWAARGPWGVRCGPPVGASGPVGSTRGPPGAAFGRAFFAWGPRFFARFARCSRPPAAAALSVAFGRFLGQGAVLAGPFSVVGLVAATFDRFCGGRVGFSPVPLPSPPPLLGAPGKREASGLGASRPRASPSPLRPAASRCPSRRFPIVRAASRLPCGGVCAPALTLRSFFVRRA